MKIAADGRDGQHQRLYTRFSRTQLDVTLSYFAQDHNVEVLRSQIINPPKSFHRHSSLLI